MKREEVVSNLTTRMNVSGDKDLSFNLSTLSLLEASMAHLSLYLWDEKKDALACESFTDAFILFSKRILYQLSEEFLKRPQDVQMIVISHGYSLDRAFSNLLFGEAEEFYSNKKLSPEYSIIVSIKLIISFLNFYCPEKKFENGIPSPSFVENRDDLEEVVVSEKKRKKNSFGLYYRYKLLEKFGIVNKLRKMKDIEEGQINSVVRNILGVDEKTARDLMKEKGGYEKGKTYENEEQFEATFSFLNRL